MIGRILTGFCAVGCALCTTIHAGDAVAAGGDPVAVEEKMQADGWSEIESGIAGRLVTREPTDAEKKADPELLLVIEAEIRNAGDLDQVVQKGNPGAFSHLVIRNEKGRVQAPRPVPFRFEQKPEWATVEPETTLRLLVAKIKEGTGKWRDFECGTGRFPLRAGTYTLKCAFNWEEFDWQGEAPQGLWKGLVKLPSIEFTVPSVETAEKE